MRSFFYQKIHGECGEKASPHVVIDVVICESGGCEGEKKPGTWFDKPGPGRGWCGRRSLEQIEFLSPADRCPAVVHPELGVNVLGVGTQSVQGHHRVRGQFPGRSSRFRAAEAPQAHVRSVARSKPVWRAFCPQPCQRLSGVDGHSSGRSRVCAASSSRTAMGGPSSTKMRT